MNIKFKIRNIYGEEKLWSPDEKINYNAWILGDGGFCSTGDKVLLCNVVDDYRFAVSQRTAFDGVNQDSVETDSSQAAVSKLGRTRRRMA